MKRILSLFLVIIIIIITMMIIPASLAPAREEKSYGNIEGVIYRGNYDGDTIRFDIPGVHPLLGENIPVRLRGIDAPEIRGKCPAEREAAVKARDAVGSILKNTKQIKLIEIGRGKYFRIVARVVVDGVDVGEILLREKLAVFYQGGKKTKDWCLSPMALR